MQYEGAKFYSAESNISDALTKINDITNNANNCINSKPNGYEYTADLLSFSEELNNIKKKITDIKDKVSELRINISNLDSAFASAYMSCMSANMDDILNGINEGTYKITDNQQINDMIYKALLDLDAAGMLDDDMKADYIASKFSDIPKDDKQIIDILFDNPGLKYNKTLLYKDGNNSFASYELLDSEGHQKYYIQKYLDVDYDIGNIFQKITSMPSALKSHNTSMVFSNTISAEQKRLQKLYNDPSYICPATGGNDVISFHDPVLKGYREEVLEKMYKNYVKEYNNNPPLNKNQYYEYYKNFDVANYMIEVIYHESAHNYDIPTHGKLKSEENGWKEAVRKDNKWASDYAATGYNSYKGTNMEMSEDYAESVKNLYILGPEEFIKQYPARAEILKKELPEMFE